MGFERWLERLIFGETEEQKQSRLFWEEVKRNNERARIEREKKEKAYAERKAYLKVHDPKEYKRIMDAEEAYSNRVSAREKERIRRLNKAISEGRVSDSLGVFDGGDSVYNNDTLFDKTPYGRD